MIHLLPTGRCVARDRIDLLYNLSHPMQAVTNGERQGSAEIVSPVHSPGRDEVDRKPLERGRVLDWMFPAAEAGCLLIASQVK